MRLPRSDGRNLRRLPYLSLLHVEDGHAWWLVLDALKVVSAKDAIGRTWKIALVSVSARNGLAQYGTVELAGGAASRWRNAAVR